MKEMLRVMLCLACIWSVASSCRAGEKINVASLLNEMTDLAGMAEFPSPAYTCKQFSSYDRAAKSPEENWFANADCGKFLRAEKNGDRDELVMMDADGPGAIVRIWSANPTGTIRFYLDGATEPTWEVPMDKLTTGAIKPLIPPLGAMTARGCNLYFPIPYAKHCKVTLDAGNVYYHINYRTYAEGTEVETFKPADLETNAERIAEIAKMLSSPRSIMTAEIAKPPEMLDLEPGKTLVLAELEGPAAINAVLCKVEAKDMTAALRQTVLRMTFDGEQTVDVPLGDFFGSAPGINPYESLPCGMSKDGWMWANWTMPFSKSARVEVVNFGKEKVMLCRVIKSSKYAWTDRSMLFHAKWRTDVNVSTRPMSDWNYLMATGKGVFAGASFLIYNPVPIWWGEGDEKIYVDGEKFPSTFGTGTEDYYGYAWGCCDRFEHAYHSQSRCDGAYAGFTSLNRWHILDRIPFQKDFRFDMELWHWFGCKVNMTVTTYYYALPSATDTYKPVTQEMVNLPMLPDIPKVAGAIEGETMRIMDRPGPIEPQYITELSSYGYMRWWVAKQGHKLPLGFNVEKAGKYQISARFLNGPDNAIFQMYINGAKAGQPVDQYDPNVVLSKDIDLGVFELKAGENVITAEMVGGNEKVKIPNVFGLDYILLKPVE